MNRYIVFRLVSALVLIAVIATLGWFAYRAGFAQGAAADIQLQAGEGGVVPYPYYGYGFRPHFFPAFGFFGLLIPLFLVFLAFGAFRRMVWGPRWGWHHRPHGPWGEGVPPMFAEWHKRAHGEEPDGEKAGQ
ncbi:MAG: hypothetical protein AB1846_00085 [Chloroflexota bacterium]